MQPTATRPALTRPVWLTRILYLTAGLAVLAGEGCSLVTIESPAQPLTEQEVHGRNLTHDFVRNYSAEVVNVADSILVSSSDPQIQMNAILWKVAAVREVRTAGFQNDAFHAFVDTWVMTAQMEQFFRAHGEAYFADLAPLVLSVSAKLVSDYDRLVKHVVREETYLEIRQFVEEYVAAHPREELEAERGSSVAAWLEFAGEEGSINNPGTVPQIASDLVSRFGVYSDQIPRQTAWQAELAIREKGLDRINVPGTLDTLKVRVDRIVALAEGSSDLVDAAILRLAEEMHLLLAAFEQQWNRMMLTVGAEREALAASLGLERQAIMDGLQVMSADAVDRSWIHLQQMLRGVLIWALLAVVIIIGGPFTLGFWAGRVSRRAVG